MNEQEQQAIWQQVISQQKKFLKTQSKNHLIRIIVEMSIRALQQEATIEQLQGEKNEESVDNSESSPQS